MSNCVITGIGVVCPSSSDIYILGRRLFQADIPWACTALQDAPTRIIGDRRLARASRQAQLALQAATVALSDSGLDPARVGPDLVGTVFEQSVGPLANAIAHMEDLETKGPHHVRPTQFMNAVPNSALGTVAMGLGLRGVSSCLTVGAAFYASRFIARGEAVAMMVVGADQIPPIAQDALVNLGLCPTPEMAFAILLEDKTHAYKRGVGGYARVLGWGISRNVDFRFNKTLWVERAILQALSSSGLRVDDVTLIISMVAGPTAASHAEHDALRRIFGSTPILSPKQTTGGVLGSSAILGFALGAGSLQLKASKVWDSPRIVLATSYDWASGTFIGTVLAAEGVQ